MKTPAGNPTTAITADREATRTSLTGWELTSMQIAKTCSLALVFGFLFCLFPPQLSAQEGGRFEVGVDYNYVHTNAPPGQCGCFSMQGGDAWVGWFFTDHLSVVAQGAVQHASNINGTTASLTLVSYMAGPRVSFRETHRIAPFAQALFGGAHSSGLLTPSPTTGLSGTANAFAFSAGGGVDFKLSRTFSIRAIQADYFYTRFDNGGNQHQNNLRLSAGLYVHF
jgi:outer membrane immunogenic protein